MLPLPFSYGGDFLNRTDEMYCVRRTKDCPGVFLCKAPFKMICLAIPGKIFYVSHFKWIAFEKAGTQTAHHLEQCCKVRRAKFPVWFSCKPPTFRPKFSQIPTAEKRGMRVTGIVGNFEDRALLRVHSFCISWSLKNAILWIHCKQRRHFLLEKIAAI